MQRVGRAVPASSGAARDIGNQPFVIWRNVAGSPNASLREIGEGFHETWNMRISTGRLNRWLEGILAHHPPPAIAGRRLKIKYITQAKTRPPGFVLSVTRSDAFPQSYLRYLINGLRETFGIRGVPVRMVLRETENPFAGRAKKRT